MSKAPTSFSVQPAAFVGADSKGSINLRIDDSTRHLIDTAASALGTTRTEFMIQCARQQAIDVLLDQRLFGLDPVRYDAFVDALNEPPNPGPKLRALMVRVAQWQR
jgi:uncharacterized protein (DUF1778 family)